MINRLKSQAYELNQATDRLNGFIVQMEGHLKRLGLGVEAWVPVSFNEELGYAKVAGAWRLAIRSGADVWALPETKRQSRADAISQMPSLLEALCQASDKFLTEINESAELARQFVESIESSAVEVRRG